MAYPTTLEDQSVDNVVVDGTTVILADHINSNNAIVDELQAKVGVDNSAVTTSHDYKIAQLEAGFTPTAYTGGETTTLPNGLIMKMGKTSTPTGDVTSKSSVAVTFGTAFPTGFLSCTVTPNGAAYPESLRHGVTGSSVSGFTINYSESESQSQNMDGFYWIAIGY